jgi:hypothetical protein
MPPMDFKHEPDRQQLEKELRGRLRSIRNSGERRTITSLARELGKLPGDSARAALEVCAGLAGVSLRAGVEFLRAAPAAAAVLNAEELRVWGEMGRRLAMADVDTGVIFFAEGVDELRDLPHEARPALLEVCLRQLSLSSSIALETFRGAAELTRVVSSPRLMRPIYEVALEIARRSAKHSADFLSATPRVIDSLLSAGVEGDEVAHDALQVASQFAIRAGGIASDMWEAVPTTIAELDEQQTVFLFNHSQRFLDRGGAAALHAFVAGGEVLRLVPDAFAEWTRLLRVVAEGSNAAMVGLARMSPAFFRSLSETKAAPARVAELARRVIVAAREVAAVDVEAAISCFRSGPQALRSTTIEQFERWASDGLSLADAGTRARRSYYALETRRSTERLQGGGAGLALENVAQTLRYYVEGLTGRAVDVAPLASVPDEQRIGDGRVIHLPASVSEFGDEAMDFRLYKVLAAHAAGQIEFGTHERATLELRAAYSSLAELYAPENIDARDAFALDGYINQPGAGERAGSPNEPPVTTRMLPADGDYRAVLALFPQAGLAARIFGTLENGRIDRQLRHRYRGLARDLDLVREHLRQSRPRIASLPTHLVPFELLFQITLCAGALDDARAFYTQIVSELESIVADYLTDARATVADTLMATSRVYSLFQSVVPEMQEQAQESGDSGADDSSGAQASAEREKDERDDEARDQQAEDQRRRDARELFNAWAAMESPSGEGDEALTGAERWFVAETPEQQLEAGETSFEYDEWDRDLSDTRVGWCRVIEKRVRRGERSFVELTRSRYRGVISSIRHQFQLMKPESLKRVREELDGDDYDLNALIDYVVDRRVDGHQSERIYTKRLRRERDVAVSFLLDQSSSTARTIGRHPLQPYSHPGRRIIEVEKEGLVLMSEALEAVGDQYSIYGFTSEGRRNVKFYVIKDFDERYADEVEQRIGGINYQNNTRLGAAIRHAAAKLVRKEARTRLLIVLSDGRPYDHDYGDARYAREDTREALRQARVDGITPFCITIDRDSEAELRDLYGEVGYTIIDDVLTLPERMPAIYRRLTT